MTKKVLAFFTIVLFLFSSCQKTELAQQQSTTNPSSADKTTGIAALSKGTVSNAHWFGDYFNMYDHDGNPLAGGDPDLPHIADTQIISNDVAMMPSLLYSDLSSYFSYIEFDIPGQYNISGDSLSYEVVVKNPKGYGSVSDYDVLLTIQGAQNIVEVHFVADAAYQASTGYSLGNVTYINLPQLVNYFGDFKTVKLTTKKGQTAVYVNNKLLYHFNYNTAGSIGRINSIKISGAGTPVIDNVKLTNSYTNKKLMLEDFNTTGQSHTIFY